MTMLIAGLLESGLFDEREDAVMLLDREYWPALRRSAEELREREVLSDEVQALFSPARRLFRHVEPHHHHLHVRVRNAESEEAVERWESRQRARRSGGSPDDPAVEGAFSEEGD
jgi:hypothetical protein